jgi:hypothetical protein
LSPVFLKKYSRLKFILNIKIILFNNIL